MWGTMLLCKNNDDEYVVVDSTSDLECPRQTFRQGQVPDWDNQRDMELHPIDEVEDFEGIESLHLGEGDSIYFTPSGTPLRCELLL